ncbi:MAG: twin-arginine translocase subunit TatC [Gemmatimonadaceae bacterium]|nr:twin-arginine translocase subunit TatC [Gemmatimonadaceae bacterium]
MIAPVGAAEYREGYRIGRRIVGRIPWVAIAAGATFGAVFWQHEALFRFLLIPGGEKLSPFGGKPIVTGVTDMMGLTIELAFKCSVIVAVIALEIAFYTLLLPPLPERGLERPRWQTPFLALAYLPFNIFTQLRAAFSTSLRRFVFVALLSINLCFLAGAAFAYYVMTPVGIPFLLRFGKELVEVTISFTSYMDFLLSMTFWMGFVFELPPLMYLLAKFGAMSYQRFRRFRKFMPLASLIFGAVITADGGGLTMFMVAVPMWLLYETGLFFAWLAHREEDDYAKARAIGRSVRKCGHGISAAYWWLYGLPAMVFDWLTWGPRKLWRRVRR